MRLNESKFKFSVDDAECATFLFEQISSAWAYLIKLNVMLLIVTRNCSILPSHGEL